MRQLYTLRFLSFLLLNKLYEIRDQRSHFVCVTFRRLTNRSDIEIRLLWMSFSVFGRPLYRQELRHFVGCSTFYIFKRFIWTCFHLFRSSLSIVLFCFVFLFIAPCFVCDTSEWVEIFVRFSVFHCVVFVLEETKKKLLLIIVSFE